MTGSSHQATCVAVGGRGLLIEGAPGTGKSSLALALIDRGAMLVGDDGVLLERRLGQLWALPHPNIAGLLELRNVGLLTYPCAPAPIALVLRLDEAAPRHVETPERTRLAGHDLPLLRLWPGGAVLHLRAEAALNLYGEG